MLEAPEDAHGGPSLVTATCHEPHVFIVEFCMAKACLDHMELRWGWKMPLLFRMLGPLPRFLVPGMIWVAPCAREQLVQLAHNPWSMDLEDLFVEDRPRLLPGVRSCGVLGDWNCWREAAILPEHSAAARLFGTWALGLGLALPAHDVYC